MNTARAHFKAVWLFLLAAFLFAVFTPSAHAIRSTTATGKQTIASETRVGVFEGNAPGRFLLVVAERPDGTRVLVGCVYENASGLREWLNRDKLGERAGFNLHRFVENDAVKNVDFMGMDIYILPGFHSKIVGDDGNGGSYSIDYGPPDDTPFLRLLWPFNEGEFRGGNFSLLKPCDIADLHNARRVTTSKEADRTLSKLADQLHENKKTPPYNLLYNNCQHFGSSWEDLAKKLSNASPDDHYRDGGQERKWKSSVLDEIANRSSTTR